MLQRIFAGQLLLIIAGFSHTAHAEPIDLARELVQLSQGETVLNQMFETLTPQIMGLALNKNPDLSDEKKAKIEGILLEELQVAVPEFLEETAKIYARNFTEAELQDVIDFYNSPTGSKFQQLAPQLMQESMVHGQALGQTVGTRAVERLRADGDL